MQGDEVDKQIWDTEVEGREEKQADGVVEVVNEEEEELNGDVQEYGAEGEICDWDL